MRRGLQESQTKLVVIWRQWEKPPLWSRQLTLHVNSPFLLTQAKCLKSATLAEPFSLIDVFITPIVPGSRIALRVFI